MLNRKNEAAPRRGGPIGRRSPAPRRRRPPAGAVASAAASALLHGAVLLAGAIRWGTGYGDGGDSPFDHVVGTVSIAGWAAPRGAPSSLPPQEIPPADPPAPEPGPIPPPHGDPPAPESDFDRKDDPAPSPGAPLASSEPVSPTPPSPEAPPFPKAPADLAGKPRVEPAGDVLPAAPVPAVARIPGVPPRPSMPPKESPDLAAPSRPRPLPAAAGLPEGGPVLGAEGTPGDGRRKRGIPGSARQEYIGRILERLQAAKRYPAEARARGLEGDAEVLVTIGADGSLLGVELRMPAGHRLLDDEAVALVRRAAPFDPIPPEVGLSRWRLLVPIRFRIRGN